MLIETRAQTITSAAIALALGKAVKYAIADKWLGSMRVYAFQNKPKDGLDAWNDAGCISGAFEFRATLASPGNPSEQPGKVWALDNGRVAKGLAKLASSQPDAFGRIVAQRATVADCTAFLQLALFGVERF